MRWVWSLFLACPLAWAQSNCEGLLLGGKNAQRWAAAAALGLTPAGPVDFTITRAPFRNTFRYYEDDRRVTDLDVIARLDGLKIRPDLTDVRISSAPLSHLQAFGVDAAGRTQRIYQPLWVQARDQAKFDRLLDFGKALPQIRVQATADFAARGLSKRRLLGALVILLDHTHIRIGNPDSAAKLETFGLTTMQKSHVRLYGTRIRFSFSGKSAQDQQVDYDDPDMADFIKELRTLPGDSLFKSPNDAGDLAAITAGEVNDYLSEITGQDFTAKEFRTWAGTVAATEFLLSIVRPSTESGMKTALQDAAEASADQLGNTGAVSRRAYIHPAVFATYQNADQWDATVAGTRAASHLSRSENAVLKMLSSEP